jgi:hypothetical protein
MTTTFDLIESVKMLLHLRPGSDILSNRESSQLEFKVSFNLGSGSEYARSMAAFANNEGGYIVFGVQDSPHKLVGISRDRFEAVDPVKITEILNSCFSPEIVWDSGCIEIEGKTLGFIYTYQALEKPIVATKNSGKEIREAHIYYRYRAKTTTICYPELRNIIEDRLDRERKAWLQHLQTIGRSGPTKVGIIDTIQGKVFGGGAPFLIDEKLLRQLKFIRQGSFRDTGGQPILRLIGDVRTIDGVTIEKSVPTGIHYDDLVTAFLANRSIGNEEAQSYLVECAHQNTPYSPVLFFLSKAKLHPEKASELLDQEQSAFKNIVKAIKKRLTGAVRVSPFGKIDPNLDVSKILTSKQLLDEIKKSLDSEKRSLIYQILRKRPQLVREVSLEIPAKNLFEAVSNLSKHEILKGKDEILGSLLDIFVNKFEVLKGAEKTFFRKSVAHVEEELYG